MRGKDKRAYVETGLNKYAMQTFTTAHAPNTFEHHRRIKNRAETKPDRTNPQSKNINFIIHSFVTVKMNVCMCTLCSWVLITCGCMRTRMYIVYSILWTENGFYVVRIPHTITRVHISSRIFGWSSAVIGSNVDMTIPYTQYIPKVYSQLCKSDEY